jgi:cytochrome c
MLNKLNKKLIVSASVVAAALFVSGCTEGAAPADSVVKKPSIDGGVYYPIANGKTGPYAVNEKAHSMVLNNGREATANELKAWDKDLQGVATGNRGLPEGAGTVEDGEALYEAQCVMCHGDFGSGGGGYPSLSKGNAYDLQKTLTNQRNLPENDGPVRVFGSYWPEASTMWWYIRDAMPHTKSKTLTDDETYALTAYMLYINEMEVNGEAVDEEFELNQDNFKDIRMPNKDGFEPNIEGPTALDDVRAYYQNPANFGAKKVKAEERCMTNCQTETAEVVRIGVGIKDFIP